MCHVRESHHYLTNTVGIDYVDISQVVDTFSITIIPPPSGRRKRAALSTQCTNLTLLADAILEDDESFAVTLGSTDSGVTVDPAPLTVTILDNDCEQCHHCSILYCCLIYNMMLSCIRFAQH